MKWKRQALVIPTLDILPQFLFLDFPASTRHTSALSPPEVACYHRELHYDTTSAPDEIGVCCGNTKSSGNNETQSQRYTNNNVVHDIWDIYLDPDCDEAFPSVLISMASTQDSDLLKRKRYHSSTTPPPSGRRRAPAPTTHNTPLPAESALPPPPSNVTPPSLTTLPDEVQLLICDDLRGRDPCSAPNL